MNRPQLLTAYDYTYIGRDGAAEVRREEVLTEYAVTLVLNGTEAGRITCIPEHLEELVLGRLLTEGLITCAAEVRSLQVCPESGRITAELASCPPDRPAALLHGNHTGNEDFPLGSLSPVVPIRWKPEWIFALAEHFAAGTPLHEITWATHSCILALEDRILFTCEDISRHNALDKAIGYALRSGVPLTRCTLYSSGRIPTDMATKAIRAGIPILASKASPTSAAVTLARRNNLTLLCAARRDRMKLFSGCLPGEGTVGASKK